MQCFARVWLVLVLLAGMVRGQSTDPASLVREVVKNEIQAQTNPKPRWMYTLTKTNASGTKVTRIVETTDGLVGRLLEINGKPLDAATEQNERHRLEELRRDPRQMKQKLARQERDRDRVLKIVRALPYAFIYTWQSGQDGGKEAVLSYRPNPAFQPDSFETDILKAMVGTVRISLPDKRLIALHGTLISDVNVGLGIVGKIQKGGTLDLEQQEVAPGSWEIRRLSLKVMGRAVFRRLNMSVEESARDFDPLEHEMPASAAIELLLREPTSRAGQSDR